MKIAYLSPFSPEKSGIADFSEELVQALKKNMDIDLFYNEVPNNADIFWNFQCHPIEDFDREDVRAQYDLFVYHLGNNICYHQKIMEYALKYPGVIEVHDYCMADAVIAFCGTRERSLNWAEYSEGKEIRERLAQYFEKGGIPLWHEDPLAIPMVKPFIERAKGVVVHSEINRKRIRAMATGTPVKLIYHHSAEISKAPELDKRIYKEKLNLPEDKVIIGSFGYVTQTKRIHSVLKSLGEYKRRGKGRDFLYCIVGGVSSEFDLDGYICDNELEDNVLLTGYADLETFKEYMQACDFCINLRYPSHGETSGSLHRMFGYGKEVLVTDTDTFAEYPDNCVIRIPYDEREEECLYQEIDKLLSGERDFVNSGDMAWKYAQEHFDLDKNAKEYYDYFEKILRKSEYEKEVCAIAAYVGLDDAWYQEHLRERMQGYFV